MKQVTDEELDNLVDAEPPHPFIAAIEANVPEGRVCTGLTSCCYECLQEYGGGGTREKFEEDLSNGTICDEGYISSAGCDSCGLTWQQQTLYTAHLLIDRQPPNVLSTNFEINHIGICGDCLCFHANGDIPDDWED